MITRYYSIYHLPQNGEKVRDRKERSKEKNENPTTTTARTREAGDDFDRLPESESTDETGRRHRHGVREALVFKAGRQIGLTRRQCERWLEHQRNVMDWHFSDGGVMTCHNFRRSLRMWRVVDEVKREEREARKAEALARREIYAKKVASAGVCGGSRRRKEEELEKLRAEGEARQKAAEEARLREAIRAPDAWELCAEQCRNYDAEKCCCKAGCTIPPQLRSWPVPPKECVSFEFRV